MSESAAAPSSMSMEYVLARLSDLPVMPAVVADLVASIDDDNIDLDQLARKIERDQALASKTLRIANSPFFGLTGQIGSIQEAAAVIGLRTIRSIALASAVGNVVGNAGVSADSLRAFWLHAFETAVAARQLAPKLQVSAEHAFVAGLLHDIGKIVVSLYCTEMHAAIVKFSSEHNTDWYTAESELGVPDHGLIASALAQRWHFPEALIEALANYHSPGTSATPLAQIIHVADVLSKCNAVANGASLCIERVDERAWAAVIRSETDLHAALRALRKAGELASHLG